jgi:predicted O-methyltransferase YrrM
MHRTTVEVDVRQLREAERNLGTSGFKETINRALATVNRLAALERAVRYLELERDSLPEWNAFWARRTPVV